GTADTPFQFTGRENDGAANLHYFRARYYSPELGRFIAQDPIGFSGGVNVYAYVEGDPAAKSDPEGEFGVVGAVIGAGFDLGMQLLGNGGNFHCVNWTQVGVSAALGAVGGGVIGGAFRHTRTAKNWLQLSTKWKNVSARVRAAQNTPVGQELHHWLIERNSRIGKKISDAIKNHPWNLNPVSEAW